MDIETYEVERDEKYAGLWSSQVSLFLSSPPPSLPELPQRLDRTAETDVKFPSAENPQPSSVLFFKAWSISEYSLAYFNPPLPHPQQEFYLFNSNV